MSALRLSQRLRVHAALTPPGQKLTLSFNEADRHQMIEDFEKFEQVVDSGANILVVEVPGDLPVPSNDVMWFGICTYLLGVFVGVFL